MFWLILYVYIYWFRLIMHDIFVQLVSPNLHTAGVQEHYAAYIIPSFGILRGWWWLNVKLKYAIRHTKISVIDGYYPPVSVLKDFCGHASDVSPLSSVLHTTWTCQQLSLTIYMQRYLFSVRSEFRFLDVRWYWSLSSGAVWLWNETTATYYCLFVPTKAYIYIYICIKILTYITNAPKVKVKR
jgi:hypothetical protein